MAQAQAALDAFEPELEDAPEPEEGQEKGEPVLVNKEEKDGLEAAVAEAQAAVDAAQAGVDSAGEALAAAQEAAKTTEREVRFNPILIRFNPI